MQDSSGLKHISVFKPIDEEPMAVNNPHGLPLSMDGEGLKKGTRVGEGALREVAAYILDHPRSGPHHFVTRRALLGFHLQSWSSACMGDSTIQKVDEVHKITVLDIRLANADRHAGNILVSKEGEGQLVLIPIDHGYCLPENVSS
ncbi:Phosphatidylinositol 4-kinase gamma 2 [Vitis vinifera]|uniref:1-phosphatidylinositol 4-kinase n=1 Tax=Vitis vinifera TaxID=29760 RepID=A0A438HWY1_VITVI|nr:Phosphatidylinositol 4-kinase gamma 2 [Vitis vinifera]